MTKQDIHNRASDKAFAKLSMLTFEITDNKTSLMTGNYGGDITEDEMRMILDGNKVELKVWNYIAELIEKNE
jgi:hypothetical protein|tara:strand:+ start:399 stop:614 length:216 start_codon:yes stop_codon:yes gene_type:complete